MAYITGAANSFQDLIVALAAAAQAQGYSVLDMPDMLYGVTYSNDSIRTNRKILMKGNCYYLIDIDSSAKNGLPVTLRSLEVFVATGLNDAEDGLSSDAKSSLLSAAFFIGNSSTSRSAVFPLVYHIFSFSGPDEIYMIIRHDADNGVEDIHRYVAFGKSGMADKLPGTGAWISASHASRFYMTPTVGGYSTSGTVTYYNPFGIFWNTHYSGTAYSSIVNSHLHHDFDGNGFWLGSVGPKHIGNILNYQPNTFNQEAVLLPFRAFAPRDSSMNSLVAELAHARALRITNYDSGEVIQLGDVRWMVFPWFRKNLSSPNGGYNDSGTLGLAIRYEGS